jgi:hypothetical protein
MTRNKFNYFSDVYVTTSPIHGNGLFTKIDIPAHKMICFIGNLKNAGNTNWISEQGKMVNHAEPGNCYVERFGTSFFMYSSRDINAGEELTSDYTKLSFPFKNYVEGVTNKNK